MTPEKTSERIDNLEIILAEQQQIIDDLNEVITKQWDAQELMKHQLSKLTDQLLELEQNQPEPANQKAPHY